MYLMLCTQLSCVLTSQSTMQRDFLQHPGNGANAVSHKKKPRVHVLSFTISYSYQIYEILIYSNMYSNILFSCYVYYINILHLLLTVFTVVNYKHKCQHIYISSVQTHDAIPSAAVFCHFQLSYCQAVSASLPHCHTFCRFLAGNNNSQSRSQRLLERSEKDKDNKYIYI